MVGNAVVRSTPNRRRQHLLSNHPESILHFYDPRAGKMRTARKAFARLIVAIQSQVFPNRRWKNRKSTPPKGCELLFPLCDRRDGRKMKKMYNNKMALTVMLFAVSNFADNKKLISNNIRVDKNCRIFAFL